MRCEYAKKHVNYTMFDAERTLTQRNEEETKEGGENSRLTHILNYVRWSAKFDKFTYTHLLVELMNFSNRKKQNESETTATSTMKKNANVNANNNNNNNKGREKTHSAL